MADNPLTVAFLGTGVMGLPMARNLARAGTPVRAWNRTVAKAQPLAEQGATVCASVAEAVRGADVVITMLFDTDAVLAAMGQAWSELGADTVWVQMSTVGVEGCRRLSEAAAEHGVPFIDAPVLGTRKPAEDGALKIFAAGPPELRGRLAPVLEPMGTLACWFDQAGQASALKMVVNAWVLTVLEGTAGSLALARGLGLEPQLFLDSIAGGATDTPYAHLKGAMMLAGQYEPVSFALSGALKDAELITAAARDAGVPTELLDAMRRHLQRAVEAGHGGADMAAVYEAHRPSGT